MPVQITSLTIADVRLVVPDRFGDARGFFSETYSRRDFAAGGIPDEFVQDNHSRSASVGTVRGLHYQLPPFAQGKLVRVLKGSILDVAAGRAPAVRATSRPPLNTAIVGIERIAKRSPSSGTASVFTLTTR